MPDYLSNIFKDGPAWILAGYMIWHLVKNYKGVCDRLNEVEDFVKTKLISTLEENSEAMKTCQSRQKKKD